MEIESLINTNSKIQLKRQLFYAELNLKTSLLFNFNSFKNVTTLFEHFEHYPDLFVHLKAYIDGSRAVIV